MTDFAAGRTLLLRYLREELVGPLSRGELIDTSKDLVFETAEAAYGPFRQAANGEEIVHRDTPVRRYGIGILYPFESRQEAAPPPEGPDADTELEGDGVDGEQLVSQQATRSIEQKQEEIAGLSDKEPEELDLSGANMFHPSSFGVTFLAALPEDSTLNIEATGGRYHRRMVQVVGEARAWWLRTPARIEASFAAKDLMREKRLLTAKEPTSEGLGDLDIRVEVFTRPRGDNQSLITVCLVNRTRQDGVQDAACLFQTWFRTAVRSDDPSAQILPYPERPLGTMDDEERSIALLYHESQTFAVGHGCAANWEDSQQGQSIQWVEAQCLPSVELPAVTPDIELEPGKEFTVPMSALAGLSDDDGFRHLRQLCSLYGEWIADREKEALQLPPDLKPTGLRHMDECRRGLQRMEEGVALLEADPTALRAFQLANHAILLQQLRARRDSRAVRYDGRSKRISIDGTLPEPNLLNPPAGKGAWRPFQIAFLLLSLPSVADRKHAERETVELLWFPTGGGKTEAYLGLAAFSMFLRRLRNSDDIGIDVLMRYTLRLLTAQQFQRAASLVCAMEHLRRQSDDLGSESFSIGMWLGMKTTPNTRVDAKNLLRALNRGDRYAANRFVLLKCPWCSASMGPLEPRPKARSAPKLVGYQERLGTVALVCPDSKCEFHDGLPVYVIDEDIYEVRPSIVIGTVDKFALLAWRPESRSLFGKGPDGSSIASPPGLVIQDELHLISGPLGSLVGLYESVIEDLCSDRNGQRTKPKIISSTATIRRYEEQVRGLYARDRVELFPPRGLRADNSFFARYATDHAGKLLPGKIYVGIHAPSLPSTLTTEVRTFASLIQAPMELPEEERDPWWTMVSFFNSLRELGTALTLFQSDIPDYLTVIRNRLSLPRESVRRLRNTLELTGRLESEDVPAAIAALEVKSEGPGVAVDACLASNIMEVGIDIDRLSLMAIVSQPKTTSTYIQVTGRIGRLWKERPGLVVTIYSPQRPRDRSHFEKFKSYHTRLYAQVEPTSVTPFSPPALERALHGLLATYVRQRGDQATADSPYPIPQKLINEVHELLTERVTAVDSAELDSFETIFQRRVSEWSRWERIRWSGPPGDDDQPLLRPAGEYVTPARAQVSWPTPTSLRTVDAECLAEVTTQYLVEEESE